MRRVHDKNIPLDTRFGFLIVCSSPYSTVLSGKRHIVCDCRCVCGKVTQCQVYLLLHGLKRSCGCKRKELQALHHKGKKALNGVKVCSSCSAHKPVAEFGRHRMSPDGYSCRCKECSRNARLKHRYGLSKEDYDNLFHKQNGRCAICLRLPKRHSRQLAVDHCHATGVVRGLLCQHCNTMIGHSLESACTLDAGARYLERHG